MAPKESTNIWVSLRRIRHATGSKLDDRVCIMSRPLCVHGSYKSNTMGAISGTGTN